MALTPKQARFVEEYLVDLNASAAAERAGYSPRTAYSIGGQLLAKPEVAAALEAAKAARSERTAITADRVLEELGRIGFSDVRMMFTPGGSLLVPTDLSDEIAPAVQSVEAVERPRRNEAGEVEIEMVRKVRLHDKLGALTLIAKHLGMITERRELSGPNGGPIPTEGKVTVDHSGLDLEQLRALANIPIHSG